MYDVRITNYDLLITCALRKFFLIVKGYRVLLRATIMMVADYHDF